MIRLITENWKYKAGSIALATSLWLGMVEESELATSVLAPVQYKNLPKDLEMSSDLTDKVHLEVRGPASKLTSAMLSETNILLDLRGVSRAGERSFPVDSTNLQLPSGVALDRAVPAQIRLHFERRLSKDVPVTVRFGQPLPEGFAVTGQSVTPATLRIVGPESRVREINAVSIDALDLGDTTADAEIAANAYVPDPQVRFEGGSRVTVRVTVGRP